MKALPMRVILAVALMLAPALAAAGVTDPGNGSVYGGADLRPPPGTIIAVDAGTGTVAGQSGVTLVTGAPTAGSFQVWPLNAHSSATITVTGTFSATLQLEMSADGGLTYGPATSKILGSSSTASTVTAPGVFRLDATGMTNVRVRATTYVSGSATVALDASTAAGLSQILNPLTDSPVAATTGGATALCTGQIKATATACGSAAAHQVYTYVLDNSGNTAGTYFQIFDMAVGSVTLGTTVAARQIVVAPGGQMVIPQPVGDAYANQITLACTTTPTGLTAPTTNCGYTVFGK